MAVITQCTGFSVTKKARPVPGLGLCKLVVLKVGGP